MDFTVYYNGELIKNTEIPLSVYDHGFLYGDGVRIHLRVYKKQPFMLQEHLKTLYYSLDKLGIKINLSATTILKTIKVLLDLNSLNNALVTILVTRGEGYLNFDTNLNLSPNILIMTDSPLIINENIRYQGINLTLSEFRAYPKSFFDRNISTISSQHEIISLYHAQQKNAFEAILVNMEGFVCEGTRSTIFTVKNGKILTPDIECGLKDTVIRKVIMDLAHKLNLPAFDAFLPVNEFYNSDECFIASTELEILPAINIDKHPIGDGRPGKITTQIINSFKELILNNHKDHDI